MLRNDNIQDIYPLSPLQQGMYFHSLYNNLSSAYFEQVSYLVKGSIEQEVFRSSLQQLLQRHDILRTVFNHQKMSKPLQVVLKQVPEALFFHDLRTLSPEERQTFITGFKAKDREQGFDLTHDLLMRMNVLQTSDTDFVIIWSYHHILMDGWCVSFLIDDFYHIYYSQLQHKPVTLPAVRPYKEYIRWLMAQDQQAPLLYWTDYLKGYRQLKVVPRKGAYEEGYNTYKPAQATFVLDVVRRQALQEGVLKPGITWSHLLQTFWGILLSKYNHTRDVVFGLVVAGRPAAVAGVETMIGLFINTIPVRVQYEAQTGFTALLQQIQKASLQGADFQYSQLSDIQSVTGLRNGMFDHILVFDNYPLADHLKRMANEGEENTDQLELSGVETFEQTNYDLNVLINLGEVITISYNYNSRVYSNKFIDKIGAQLNTLIDQVIQDPAVKIETLSIRSITDKLYLTGADQPELAGRYRHYYLHNSATEPMPDSMRIYLLDEQGQAAAVGVKGQICISVEQLNLCHLSEEDVLPEKFVVPSFAPGSRLLRTGEVGRWLAEGTIEFLGRQEDQHTIRGYQVDTFLVKKLLATNNAVKETAIVAAEDASGEKYLVAFYTAGEPLDSKDLRYFLGKAGLPDPYIPEKFEYVERLPLTVTGDIDHEALIQQCLSSTGEVPYEPPVGLLEEQLAGIWNEVLSRTRVGVNDNFFQLTGNSIKAIQVVARMYKAGYKVSVRSIFTYPTIRELAGLLSLSANNQPVSEETNTSISLA